MLLGKIARNSQKYAKLQIAQVSVFAIRMVVLWISKVVCSHGVMPQICGQIEKQEIRRNKELIITNQES